MAFSPGQSSQAKSKGKGKDKKGKGKKDKGADQAAGASDHLDAESEKIIRKWFSDPGNLEGLPPGLAKREALPPGLQRQLEKNGTLPPGLQKKIQPLPAKLENRLPVVPEGTRRIVLGGNVILLDETTSTILDIIRDVLD